MKDEPASDGAARGVRAATDPPDATRRQFIVAGSTVAIGAAVVGWPGDSGASAGAVGATQDVRLVVNGMPRDVVVDPRVSLLDVLREGLQLTGTKKGCNQGACGACTVLVDGRRVLSCLTLAAMSDGADITTIEGVATGDALHPLQAAFIEHEGFQCGYCTAGQIMSGLGCIAEGHAGSPDEIRSWMSGNICRCGAYPGIVAAVADAAKRA